jgi:CRP/FNR family transcriptional regulator
MVGRVGHVDTPSPVHVSRHPFHNIDDDLTKIACRNCNIFQLCLPVGISDPDLELLDRIIKRRRPLAKGEHLYRIGDPFEDIYAIRAGTVKSYVPVEGGQEQVTGLFLPGELVGLEAINGGVHTSNAKALETSSFCVIPFDRLEELADSVTSLRHQLFRLLSRQIQHDRELLQLLGKHSAEKRLASLLLSISMRLAQRGFSDREFHLALSRIEISSFLGLAVETVSRLFSRLQKEGIIAVRRKHVIIKDLESLKALAG